MSFGTPRVHDFGGIQSSVSSVDRSAVDPRTLVQPSLRDITSDLPVMRRDSIAPDPLSGCEAVVCSCHPRSLEVR
jgi:hypothetical protein